MPRTTIPSRERDERGMGAAGSKPLSRFIPALKIAIAALGVLFVLFSAAGLYLFSLWRSLPDLDVHSAELGAARTSIVYASDGSVLAEWHGEQDRRIVNLAEIAKPMRDAVIAIEDQRFYEHDGVDWRSIVRATRTDGTQRAYAQGGSTITQQLVKLLFTSGDRTFGRKIREALLAYDLETKSDKDKVLEAYLNIVYFGHGAYGVESAARAYFGKSAGELTLPESALLAGLIRSPQKYSPTANPASAKVRRDLVLTTMREEGYVSAQDAAAARRVRIKLVPLKDVPPVAPHFLEHVKQDLVARLGADAVFKGGLRIHTTLNRSLQLAAEKAARSRLPSPRDPDVAIVSLEPKTGRILAMVGGKDFRRDQFNLAAQGRRQPGSAFKPFVLVTALEQGVPPDRVFAAAPYSVKVKDGTWNVQNYENAATAPSVTLRAATEWSVNAVYARLIMGVGPGNVVKTASKMGITSPLDPDPAIALGGLRVGVSPLEMASAYGTLATGGIRVKPQAVIDVTDDTGRVVYEPKTDSRRALSPAVAATASDMLHDVVEHGTGTVARMAGRWSAGKTGTTQSYRDAWFVGWSGDVVAAVWVGYAKGQVPMLNVYGIKVTGGSYPAIIWNGYMSHAVNGASGSVASSPPASTKGLALVRICADTMLLANRRCPNVIEMYLAPGQVPTVVCNKH